MSQDQQNLPCQVKPTTAEDVPVILGFIKQLADYEKLSHEAVATEADITESLFGENRYAECVIAWFEKKPVGFALYFNNYSTFLGKPGIYLEDLFVLPDMRGCGFGNALLSYVAKVAVSRGCGRFEWADLDWNEPAIKFYEGLGAQAMNEWTIYRVTGKALENLADQSS